MTKTDDKGESLAERIKLIGGLVAVAIGVLAVAVIALYAISQNDEDAGTIASAAGGVIASIVGAYFGVKIGSDQTKNAQDGLKQEAAKAQAFAAHLSPADADRILEKAQMFAEKAVRS
jgi:hypothetical protein